MEQPYSVEEEEKLWVEEPLVEVEWRFKSDFCRPPRGDVCGTFLDSPRTRF